MTRNRILASIATIAIVAATPSLAKPGGGGGGGGGHGHGQGGVNAGAGAGANVGLGKGGGMGAGASGKIGGGADVSTRVNSMDSGSTTRIRGNANTGVSTRTNMGQGNVNLTGVVDGMAVVDSGGATVGTVTNISTRGNSGKVRSVEVTLTDGTVVNLAPNSLSLDGDVLTTSSVESTARVSNQRANSQGAANANINGLVNSSPNSALAGAGVTTLTGLTAGMTINDSAGASIGTVSEVIVNRKSGAVVGIRVDLAAGGSVVLPANTLTMNGTAVTTSSTNF